MSTQTVHFLATWNEHAATRLDPEGIITARIERDIDGALKCILSIPVVGANARKALRAFAVRQGEPRLSELLPPILGLKRLGRAVWTITPSIAIDDHLAAFVTITDVPDPAPFLKPEERSESVSQDSSAASQSVTAATSLDDIPNGGRVH